jgi:hypothetical protein
MKPKTTGETGQTVPPPAVGAKRGGHVMLAARSWRSAWTTALPPQCRSSSGENYIRFCRPGCHHRRSVDDPFRARRSLSFAVLDPNDRIMQAYMHDDACFCPRPSSFPFPLLRNRDAIGMYARNETGHDLAFYKLVRKRKISSAQHLAVAQNNVTGYHRSAATEASKACVTQSSLQERKKKEKADA